MTLVFNPRKGRATRFFAAAQNSLVLWVGFVTQHRKASVQGDPLLGFDEVRAGQAVLLHLLVEGLAGQPKRFVGVL